MGNSTRRTLRWPVGSVHPHTRGEFSLPFPASLAVNGSPPHAWGIHQHNVLISHQLRFTPTRVGNSKEVLQRMPKTSVHPHTRGEFFGKILDEALAHGSPPHAWGILARQVCRRRLGRFTPTRVGNSLSGCHIVPGNTVHPHTRGEFLVYRATMVMPYGSPPHAWGIL